MEIHSEDVKKERLKILQQIGVTINHEVNNPLAGILGNVELLLLDNNLNEGLQNKLQIIKRLSLKIRDIIRKMANITDPVLTQYDCKTEMIDIRRSPANGIYEYIN